eukprot:scaffold79803_cov32-Tisochrysis_lutea.AAC.3
MQETDDGLETGRCMNHRADSQGVYALCLAIRKEDPRSRWVTAMRDIAPLLSSAVVDSPAQGMWMGGSCRVGADAVAMMGSKRLLRTSASP